MLRLQKRSSLIVYKFSTMGEVSVIFQKVVETGVGSHILKTDSLVKGNDRREKLYCGVWEKIVAPLLLFLIAIHKMG